MTDSPLSERPNDDLATELRRLAGRLSAQESRFDELAAAIGALERRHDQTQESIDRLRAAVEPARLAALGEGAADDIARRADFLSLVAAVRRTVRDILPKEARVLVVARGDDELLHLAGRRAGHFPQGADGGYAGELPTTAADAVARLDAMVAAGWDHLVIPAPSTWWLEGCPGVRRHLHRRWHLLHHAPGTCLVFRHDPSRPGAWHRFDALLERVRSGEGRVPAILDWDTDCGLADLYPECSVFGPVDRGADRLPYATASVDVVAVPWEARDRLEEARRIGRTAVVRIAPPGVRDDGFVVAVESIERAPSGGRQAPPTADDPPSAGGGR